MTNVTSRDQRELSRDHRELTSYSDKLKQYLKTKIEELEKQILKT